ncbi:hypothetical protein QE417_003827 [Mucilaginibacter terrae]|uniref:Uncharacterized protein n=2 Tax=Mucilaginibacter terrae TaxID=1955052 RepID=A0ABU3GYM4_9SPHI|nr:hypothetical protein [Mucilaginibacter terrae]
MLRLRFLQARMACIAGVLITLITASGFTVFNWNRQQALLWSSQCLYQAFNTDEVKLKNWELNITPDYFVRLRKTYPNGKQEYFSFHLKRFNTIDYYGNTTRGLLCFKTQADDIIVQTHNDRKGNIDSMATTLKISVKNMSAERLDSLLTALNYLKQQ